MKSYEHVLLASDFSEASKVAGFRAANLARHEGAKLTLLNVIEHFPEDLSVDTIPPEDQDPATFLKNRAHEKLARQASELQFEGVELVVTTTTHSAKHEILAYAEGGRIDLIVVGAHKGSRFGGSLGSTAGSIVGGAACDVLVVRPHGE